MARRGGTLERLELLDQHEDGRADQDEPDEPDEDWTTVWSCACGYGNVGRERCTRCGKRAPAEAREAGGLWVGDDQVAAMPSERAGRKAGRTVAATIGLNLLLQVVVAAFVIANDLGLAATVRISLFTSLGYYTAVTFWVLGRSVDLGLRPRSGGSTALVGAAEGFVVGGGLALLLVALVRLAVGHPVLDPTAAVLAAQSSVAPLVIGFLMIAVLGPVVEELVFRGFLAEAFRKRGRRSAVLISAVGFSLAHLRLSQFRYYLAMGVVFSLVYWRRGLVGSIAAHAAFNGMLVVVAVAATHGPAQQVRTADFAVTIPAAWNVNESQVGRDLAGRDLVARSPSAHKSSCCTLTRSGSPTRRSWPAALPGAPRPCPPGSRWTTPPSPWSTSRPARPSPCRRSTPTTTAAG